MFCGTHRSSPCNLKPEGQTSFSHCLPVKDGGQSQVHYVVSVGGEMICYRGENGEGCFYRRGLLDELDTLKDEAPLEPELETLTRVSFRPS